MDVLDEILASLRLTGGVVIDGEFSGDFCVLAQFTPHHFAPFFPQPDTLISYHYVRSGKMLIEVDGQAPEVIDAGTIAILPRNDPHTLSSRLGLPPADASDVLWVTKEGVHHVSTGTDGPKNEVWCGFLGAAKGTAHPLLDSLPPLLTLDVSGGEAQWLESSMRFLAEQSPPAEIVAKLAELFLAQAIREYVEQLPASSKGWLQGLADPAVSKALSIIHNRYAEELDVEGLAREAGVSRSVLGERFAELIGEPPMRYCARWRMRVAANMLRDGKQNTANIAYSVGFNSEAAFNRAFKREYGEPPATWRRKVEAEEEAQARRLRRRELPPQQVQYCKASDGTRLAYSVTGKGPPIVKTANWLNHIEHDWDSPLWRHWIEEFTDGRSLVRYDERGNGLSDWDTPELSLDAFVSDLEAVVDELKLETFDLLAISQGAAVAIAYAIRHPERVRHLVICNGYAAGWAVRSDPAELARREAMLTLTEVGWGADNPAYRQLFTNIYIPEASPKQMGWFNEMQRKSASPENAVKLQRALGSLDVRALLPKVTTPTLIFHSRNDQAVPFSQGEQLAASIPGAMFVPLESKNHILLESEPAWTMFAEISGEFLQHQEWQVPAAPAKVEAQAQSCVARDGTKLAYSLAGEGFPLVKVPNWFNHLERDCDSPIWSGWFEELASGRQLLWFDGRGHGASDWDSPGITPQSFEQDLADVVDAAGLERFDLLGIGHGAAVSLAYAMHHPERVRRIVMCNGWCVGWARRGDAEDVERRRAIIKLSGIGWDDQSPVYRDIYTKLYIPGGTKAQKEWLNEAQRLCTTPENAVAIQMAMGDVDLSDAIGKIEAPCLLFHARGDQAVPFSQGEQLAGLLADVRFEPLDSDNHIYLPTERAWGTFSETVREFLGSEAVPVAKAYTPSRSDQGADELAECSGTDGARIAYAVAGEGFPLVKTPNWMTHLRHDWTSPVYGHWLREGARANRLIRADMRGFGMSDWDPPEFDFEHMVGDLAAVVDAAGAEQCDLLGISHGAPIAIAYAARNPDRVRKLVLVNSFAAGWRVRADPEEIAWRESLLEMNRRQPSFRRSLLGEMFITLYFPSASQALINWHNELFETLGPVPNMTRMIELAAHIDVRSELKAIRAPTLVCHSRQDANAPIAVGRQVAEEVKDARFVELDGANHILLADEPAWPAFVKEMRAFLAAN
jgi:pimeloyl-ACP methyl ester carboxylesterase/AraC-like DNA-binding protein